MSLRLKTLIIIGSTLTILILGMYALSQVILLQSYVRLEEQTVERNVQRVINALNDRMSVLHSTNVDWAHWNDTYEFINTRSPDYIAANTYDGTFNLYGLNFMLFLNMDNEVVFSRAYDLSEQTEVPVSDSLTEIAQDPTGALGLNDASGALITNGVYGLMMLPEGPALIASTPILPTDLNGPPRGRIIWGRYLDNVSLSDLAEQTQLMLSAHALNSENVPPVSRVAREANPIHLRTMGAETIYGSALIRDIFGQPALWLQIEQPRSIYNQGQNSLFYFLLSLLVLGSVFAIATILLLERVVLSRLAFLHERVLNISRDGDLANPIGLPGKDELSSLAAAMNTTLESLARTQERLKQARDHALEASRAKAQILANVSHDARTPLSVILLRAEMLQKELYGPITEKQSAILDSILANARQLLGFISNLLDGAQLESGKLQLHKTDFSPGALLESINDSFQPLATHKGLLLKTSVDVDVPSRLYGDADRLTQILFNLVGNAIKFTPTGEIAVHLYLYDTTNWAMEVRDTGIGISLEHQGRIFESFWQVDGTSTRLATSGVGLGLSIVKQLTTMMGGFVEVKSEAQSGSVFTVVLPIERVEGEFDARAEVGVNH